MYNFSEKLELITKSIHNFSSTGWDVYVRTVHILKNPKLDEWKLYKQFKNKPTEDMILNSLNTDVTIYVSKFDKYLTKSLKYLGSAGTTFHGIGTLTSLLDLKNHHDKYGEWDNYNIKSTALHGTLTLAHAICLGLIKLAGKRIPNETDIKIVPRGTKIN